MKKTILVIVSFSFVCLLYFTGLPGVGSDKKASFRDAPSDLPPIESLEYADPDFQLPIPVAGDNSANAGKEGGALKMGPDAGQIAMMLAKNEAETKSFEREFSKSGGQKLEAQYRPFADYEDTGYLIMNSDFNFDSRQAKLEAAKALPPDGILVILVASQDNALKERILNTFSAAIPKERIKVAAVRGAGNAFWARDAMPVPVFDKKSGAFTVIDAKYYHPFSADSEVAGLFGAKMESHDFYYEGGNFMASDKGVCLMVNNDRHAIITDEIYKRYYGCEKVIRLPFLAGIGHVDEHARFVDEKTVLTDLPEYGPILEKEGLRPVMVPRPGGTYETHVNSLIIEGKAVVPVFGKSSDAQALAVYESVGLKPAGARSSSLSNTGQGSVHCITMTYPKVPAAELMKALGAEEF